MTSKEALQQLNEQIGITDKDYMLSENEVLSVEEMLENSKIEFEKFKQSIIDNKENIEVATNELKKSIQENNSTDSSIVAISTFKESIDALSNLIYVGEDIMKELVNGIKSTDIIDPDVVSSTANIIEGIRNSIADIINYNTEKMKLEHQYRLMMDSEKLKQRHRLELEYFKSELRIKEMQKKSDIRANEEKMKAIPVSDDNQCVDNAHTWSQLDIINILRHNNEDNIDNSK